MEQALALPDKAIIMLISTPKTENYLLKTINTRWNILKLVTVISLQTVAMVLLLIHQLLWATLTKVLWSRTSPSQTVALEAHWMQQKQLLWRWSRTKAFHQIANTICINTITQLRVISNTDTLITLVNQIPVKRITTAPRKETSQFKSL